MAIEQNEHRLPQGAEVIDWLRPSSAQHEFVLQYLNNRITYSESRMSNFYSRWRLNELQLQAYISLPEYDRLLKDVQEARSSEAVPVAINVPFSWSTVNTIVTYLLHMFGGRKPIFTTSSYRPEQVKRARNMEMLLQYNSDYAKFLRTLYFFLMDGETYGLAVMRTMWRRDVKQRTIIIPPSPDVAAMAQQFGQTAQGTPQKQSYVSFEGNDTANIDPFMFFPDPRVPMHEVNTKGEFVFWRAFEGRHILLREQAAGRLKYVDKAELLESTSFGTNSYNISSNRGMRSLGDPSPGADNRGNSDKISANIQVDQGTVDIIPKDLGFSDSMVPEKWLFTILNKKQIVQAVKLDTPHGKHPVEVAEPNSTGYAFGQLGTVDMLGPMQNMMSWFMNSHVYNVRAALNNLLVVDPSKVEMQDLKRPTPGGFIRLKNTAFGMADPRMAVQQLPVSDVTRSHVSDFQMFGRLASDITGATDNVRGLQDGGGRKTATEIRTSAEAGTSRLASKGKVYSAMAMTGLAEQWAANYQANMTSEFELQILGQEAQQNTVRITPESISGDFFFPVHDGTLPVDKIGMLDSWKEIFLAIMQDPTGQLRQNFDVLGIFEWLCQLGGAQNIQSFRLQQVPDQQQQHDIQAGNGVPMAQLQQQLAGGR